VTGYLSTPRRSSDEFRPGIRRNPALVVPASLDRIIPRLHVEAAPDVDAELAQLTEEERATTARP
jgi:hypothetical protein